jgi:hypothetical protein
MVWRHLVLTTEHKPAPSVKVSVNKDIVSIRFSREISESLEITRGDIVDVSVDGDMVLLVRAPNSKQGTRVKKDGNIFLINFPRESYWPDYYELTRCSYKAGGDNNLSFIIAMPWQSSVVFCPPRQAIGAKR